MCGMTVCILLSSTNVAPSHHKNLLNFSQCPKGGLTARHKARFDETRLNLMLGLTAKIISTEKQLWSSNIIGPRNLHEKWFVQLQRSRRGDRVVNETIVTLDDTLIAQGLHPYFSTRKWLTFARICVTIVIVNGHNCHKVTEVGKTKMIWLNSGNRKHCTIIWGNVCCDGKIWSTYAERDQQSMRNLN